MKLNSVVKTCPVCNNNFIPINAIQKYCCKECQKSANKNYRIEYAKKYYKINRNKLLKQSKLYRYINKEKIKQKVHLYYLNNKEMIKKRIKNYTIKNKEKIFNRDKKYRQNNRNIINKNRRKWQKTDIGKEYNKRHKFKRRNRKISKRTLYNFTVKQWIKLLEEYKYSCAYCKAEFDDNIIPTQDHIIPVSKGGNHTKDNILPACIDCNIKKSNKDLGQFLKERFNGK